VFNVPGEPVGEIAAAYVEALGRVSAGELATIEPLRRLTQGAFTRGHFVRAV
jgi:hypothetical protein